MLDSVGEALLNGRGETCCAVFRLEHSIDVLVGTHRRNVPVGTYRHNVPVGTFMLSVPVGTLG